MLEDNFSVVGCSWGILCSLAAAAPCIMAFLADCFPCAQLPNRFEKAIRVMNQSWSMNLSVHSCDLFILIHSLGLTSYCYMSPLCRSPPRVWRFWPPSLAMRTWRFGHGAAYHHHHKMRPLSRPCIASRIAVYAVEQRSVCGCHSLIWLVFDVSGDNFFDIIYQKCYSW